MFVFELIQVGSPRTQNRDLRTDDICLRKVNVTDQQRRRCTGLRLHAPPWVTHERMCIGDIARRFVPCRGTAREEALVIERPRAKQQLPMRRTGRHIERRRNNDQPRSLKGKNAKQLCKAHIKADGSADLAEWRVKERIVLSGCECVRLEKPLTARHINVKQMHLAVLCPLRPVRVKDIAGVVDRVPVTLRHRARSKPNAALARSVAQQTPRPAALRFSVFRKRRVAVRTAPHLRQHDQITAGRSCIAHIAAHRRIIFRFGRRDRHLAQAKFHGIPAFA